MSNSYSSILKKKLDSNFFFILIPSYLFVLLPLSLVSGPFLSDLSVSIISVIFLVFVYKNKKIYLFKKSYFIIFFVFWIYIVINSIYHFNLTSLKISFFYIRFGIFVIAVIYFIKKDEKILIYFFYCLFICFFILCLDGFFQYFFKFNFIGYEISPTKRVSSFFGDELILGSYLSRLWPILFGLGILFRDKIKINFSILIFIFILSETLIFLSGERTAFFYVNFSALFIMIFIKKYRLMRFATLICSILLIICISLFNEDPKKRIIDQTLNQIQINEISDDKDKNSLSLLNKEFFIFSKQHNQLYQTAYRIYLDNKFFGIGIKNFQNICKNKIYYISKLSCSNHPHNTYLQILSEIGIIGFSFLIIIFIFFSFNILKHFFSMFQNKYLFNDFEICLLSAIAITLWPIAPTGNFFNNWLSIIFFLPTPLLIWSLNSKKIVKNPQ